MAFIDSHVDNIIEIPTLPSLANFTVYYPQLWSSASQRGLSRLSLARDGQLPRLRYLDLTGNSLTDDSIGFIPQLTTIEELRLETNWFTTVPVLTKALDLHTFSLTLNETNTDVSIQLPNPRTQLRPLTAKLYGSRYTALVRNVTSIQGRRHRVYVRAS